VEMDVLDVRILPALLLIDDAPQIRLPELIATAAQTAPKLDSMLAQRLLDPRPQAGIRLSEYERERVIAAAFDSEIRLILAGVELGQKEFQIGTPHFVVGVEPLQLTTADDAGDFRRTHVERRIGEDEIGIQIRMLLAPAPAY